MHAARRLTVGMLTAAVVASVAGIITNGQQQTPPPQPAPQQSAPPPQPAAQQPPAQQPPTQPTFRVGATFVRVDAFVTKNGEPVGDLKPEEVEIREDNVPQTIRTFEYVNIPPANLQTGARRDPDKRAREPRGRQRSAQARVRAVPGHVSHHAGRQHELAVGADEFPAADRSAPTT